MFLNICKNKTDVVNNTIRNQVFEGSFNKFEISIDITK